MITNSRSTNAELAQEFANRVARHVPAIRFTLDAVAVVLAVATFFQVGDPDLLLHAIFLILAIQAFMGGLRPTLLRIIAGTIVVFGYSSFANASTLQPVELMPLELTEWPLMVAIAVLVAVLADRVSVVSARYARLFRQASDQLMTAQEDERRRLALDLHDGVGQTLTALTLTLDAAESLLWAGEQAPPQHARDALRRAQELAVAALEETRDLSFRLRPVRIAESGLAASLVELGRTAGGSVAVTVDESLRRVGVLPPLHELEVHRIAQEALSNALRHAQAGRIEIRLLDEGNHLRLEVEDDGVGIDLGRTQLSGLGLPGMRERAAMIGGTLTIGGVPGHGTRVALVVPIAPADQPSYAGSRAPELVQ